MCTMIILRAISYVNQGVLYGPRKWGTLKWSEYIDRNNKVVTFTHTYGRSQKNANGAL